MLPTNIQPPDVWLKLFNSKVTKSRSILPCFRHNRLRKHVSETDAFCSEVSIKTALLNPEGEHRVNDGRRGPPKLWLLVPPGGIASIGGASFTARHNWYTQELHEEFVEELCGPEVTGFTHQLLRSEGFSGRRNEGGGRDDCWIGRKNENGRGMIALAGEACFRRRNR